MRGTTLFLSALAILTLGGSLGLVIFIFTRPSGGPLVSARPTPPEPIVLGHVQRAPGQLQRGLLWERESDLISWQQASTPREIFDTMDRSTTLHFPLSTPVRLVERRPFTVQLEIMDGPLKGRRGWTTADEFIPDS